MSKSSKVPAALIFALMGVTLVACQRRAGGGAMSPTGYASGGFSYRIAYAHPPSKSLLPAPWRLDNFTFDGKTYKQKTSGTYEVTRWMDEDNDGEYGPSEKHDEPLYDVKLVNEQDNGVIWSKAHPMRHVDRNLDISVHLDNYIESLSGSGLYAEGGMFRVREVKVRDYTTFVKSKREILVDRHPGVEAVIEIAEAEKLKADPAYRKQKVKVVFVRFGYAEPITRSKQAAGWPIIDTARGSAASRRGILVLGYANGAGSFDRSLPAFDSFVARVTLPESTPPALTASASAAAAPAAPPPATASATAAPSTSVSATPPPASASASTSPAPPPRP